MNRKTGIPQDEAPAPFYTSSRSSNTNSTFAVMIRMIQIALVVCVTLGLVAMIGLIGLRYPDNHGAGPAAFRWLFATLLVGAIALCFFSVKPGLYTVILACVGMAATWLVDRRNIMIDYDEWIERGMPEWGSVTTPLNIPAKRPNPPPG